MVETGAAGRPFPGFQGIAEDVTPDVDDTRDLGAPTKRWAYLYAVIAILTSLTIGGIYLGATAAGELFINASAIMNGSLAVNESILAWGNLTAYGTNVSFPNANVTASYYFGDGSELIGIQHGSLALYLLNNASDIAGSKILFTEPGVATATTLSKAITAAGTEYQNWTTNDGVPNLYALLDGVNEMHVHARVTAGGKKDTTLLWKIWQNDTSGNMNLLFTSEESSILTTTLSAIDIHMTVDETALNLSDRLTVQLVANIAGSGGNPTVEVQIEGDTASRVELVVPGANVGTFVPYSGAIKNLNLGAYNFTTTGSFVGDGSFLTGVPYTETDPHWTSNFTAHNSSWSSTYNVTYDAYNATGLIKDWDPNSYIIDWNATGFIKDWDPNSYIIDWNSTGFIKDWDPNSYIIDWNATGFIIDWNATGFIIDWNATGFIKDWSYTETDPHWSGNQSLYYLVSNPSSFWNDTQATFNKTYADTLYYDIDDNVLSYWNDTQATFNKTYADTLYLTSFTELDPHWTGNKSSYLTSSVILGFNHYNSSDFDITDYLLDTTDTFTGNLTFADANNCIIFNSGGKICSGV